MAVSVKEVEQLNTEIENLNTERTKTEAKVEMLKKRLNDELAGFEKKYGVTLKGKTLKETAENIIRERNKVAEDIESEYNLKKQVVDAINKGNISLANSLLGVETTEVENVVDEAEKVVAKEEASKPKKAAKTVTSTADTGASKNGIDYEALAEKANQQQADTKTDPEDDEDDGFDDFGFDEPDTKSESTKKKESESESEDNEDDFGFDDLDASDSSEETSDKETENLSAASLGFDVNNSGASDDEDTDEDSDDEDDDFGFGDISF